MYIKSDKEQQHWHSLLAAYWQGPRCARTSCDNITYIWDAVPLQHGAERP